MRIAYLSHFYPPTQHSGIEQVTHSLAKEMQRAGHVTKVLCADQWTEGDPYWQGYIEDEWEGVPVRRFNINWRNAPAPNQYLYDNPILAQHTRDFLEDYQPDVVHITSLYVLSASVVRVIRDLDIPSVFNLSDFWMICPRHTLLRYDNTACDGQVPAHTCQDCLLSESTLYRMLKNALPEKAVNTAYAHFSTHPEVTRRVPGMLGWGVDIEERREVLHETIPLIDHFIAPSQYIRDTVLATGIPLKTVEVSHHGNDLDWLKNYKPRPQDSELHIGYIGQISPMKGVHLLIEAFQRNQFDSHVKLFVYGDLQAHPHYVEQLRKLIDNNPNIQLAGAFIRPDLPQVLGTIDVLTVPSMWPEVAGLVVQEAFAARIPVLASNMGGLPEFVKPDHGGLLFNTDGPEDLQHTLAHVVDGGFSLLESMRARIPDVRTTEDERQYIEGVYQRLTKRKTVESAT